MENIPDDNDLLRMGELPVDPGEGLEPVDLDADEEAEEKEFDLEKQAPLVGNFIDDAVEYMRGRRNGTLKPTPTPWKKLSGFLSGGLWPGLYILVGTPGVGKSQFSIQWALHAAERDIPVLYIGLELGKEDLVARLVSSGTEEYPVDYARHGRKCSGFAYESMPKGD